jgi:hypothetical protein
MAMAVICRDFILPFSKLRPWLFSVDFVIYLKPEITENNHGPQSEDWKSEILANNSHGHKSEEIMQIAAMAIDLAPDKLWKPRKTTIITSTGSTER